MITEPERYLEAFADAGADALTAHVEATPHIHRVLQQIHSLGLRAGVTLNPGTSVTTLEDVLDIVDLVLVMSVNPGFGGQSFIPGSLKKIRRIAKMLDAIGSDADIAVDGGVDVDTAGAIAAAGANILIAGSAIYGAEIGIAAAVHNIRQAAIAQINQQPG
jgi:ribulose-phosphate 3-epimerase